MHWIENKWGRSMEALATKNIEHHFLPVIAAVLQEFLPYYTV